MEVFLKENYKNICFEINQSSYLEQDSKPLSYSFHSSR